MGADNSLQAFDGTTGFRKWAIDFATPPVGAFTTDGDGEICPGGINLHAVVELRQLLQCQVRAACFNSSACL